MACHLSSKVHETLLTSRRSQLRGCGVSRKRNKNTKSNSESDITNSSNRSYFDWYDYDAAVTDDVAALMVAALLSSLRLTNENVEQLTTASARLGTMREQSRATLEVPNPCHLRLDISKNEPGIRAA